MKRFLMAVLALFAVSAAQMQARFYTPDFKREFNDILRNHDLAVVHFNPLAEGEGTAEEQDQVDSMKDAFVGLSKEDRYKNANVAFVGVNTTKHPALAKEYNINPNEKATVILFKDGHEFKEGKRKVGYLTHRQLRNFIEDNFGDIIDSLPKKRQVVKRVVSYPTTTRAYSYPVSSSYYDYDDYYYDYPSYSYRSYYPGYYGGYSRWGYPYYNYPYYGPGFGFSVGIPGTGIGFGIGF